MFKVVKAQNAKQYQNPTVHDEEGKFVTSPNEIQKITTEFYKKFRKDDVEEITPFQGNSRPFNREISQIEVENAVKKQNNNRATDNDNIFTEMLKYGTKNLCHRIATIINDMFGTHQQLDINNGILLSQQNLGKIKD